VITFDTREPAPLSVRWARVIVPLFLCFAYLTFRLGPATHDRVPLSELLASGVLFVGLTFVAFIALGDLLCPATPAERAAENDPESTGVFVTMPAKQAFSVTAQVTYADLGMMFPDRFPPGAGRIVGTVEDEPVTEELELLTHEYVPQHHTPARGIPVVGPEYPDQLGDLGWNAEKQGPIRGSLPAPEPRTTGRHRRVSQ
jgi:hypothetical protein